MVAGDRELQAAIHAFGYHGGPTKTSTAAMLPGYLTLPPETRPRIWASEDGNLPSDQAGAIGWGQVQNNNWLNLNVTATVRWSLIWSVPEALSPYQNRGAMMASTPWCGAL